MEERKGVICGVEDEEVLRNHRWVILEELEVLDRRRVAKGGE